MICDFILPSPLYISYPIKWYNMYVRLIITEKPSVAKTIAQALGKYQYKEDYYQVGDYKITWAYGHLLTLKMPEDYDEKYKLWRLDDLPIVPKRFGGKTD